MFGVSLRYSGYSDPRGFSYLVPKHFHLKKKNNCHSRRKCKKKKKKKNKLAIASLEMCFAWIIHKILLYCVILLLFSNNITYKSLLISYHNLEYMAHRVLVPVVPNNIGF